MALSTGQRQAILRSLGWRIRSQAEYELVVEHFQEGWNLGTRLKVDGKPGPRTDHALAVSEQRRRAGKPTMSEHFSFSEWSCHCGGKFKSCARIVVVHELVTSLESYRKQVGRPVSITSGYRCPSHNRAVKGATSSQHMWGGAADVEYVGGWTDKRLASKQLFAGLGYSAKTRLVRHVDRRDRSGHNTTNSTVARPMRWPYAS